MRVGHVALAGVVQADAGGDLVGHLVGGPDVGGPFRCVLRDHAAIGIGGCVVGPALVDLRIHQRGAGKHFPLLAKTAGDFHFDAIGVTLGVEDGDVRRQRVGVAFVQLLGAEHGGAQGGIAVGQIPLGTDFVVLVALRLLLVGGQAGRQVELVGLAGRVHQAAIAEVVAGFLGWLPDQAGTVAEAAIVTLAAAGLHAGGGVVGLVGAFQLVQAQAGHHLPLLVQRHGVGDVGGQVAGHEVVGAVTGVATGVEAFRIADAADHVRHRAAGADAVGVLRFAGEFHAGQQFVAEAAGVELAVVVDAQRLGLVQRTAQLAAVAELGGIGDRGAGRRVAQLWLRHDHLAVIAADAQLGGDLVLAVQFVGGAHCADVGGDVLAVHTLQAVVAVHRHVDRLQRVGVERHAQHRGVVFLQLHVRQHDGGRFAEAEGDRRRDAVALGFADAVRAAVIGGHHVQADGGGIGQRLVDVGGAAIEIVGADGGGQFHLFAGKRGLADLVDHATGGAATEQHRAGALQHLDALVVERVAVVLRHVALTVAVGIAKGGEATQDDGVAGAAALTGDEGDAGHVFQHVLHVDVALVGDQLAGDHRYRLRYILQCLLLLAQRGGGGIVATTWCLFRLDLDGFQLRGIAALGIVGQRQARRQADGQHAGEHFVRSFFLRDGGRGGEMPFHYCGGPCARLKTTRAPHHGRRAVASGMVRAGKIS